MLDSIGCSFEEKVMEQLSSLRGTIPDISTFQNFSDCANAVDPAEELNTSDEESIEGHNIFEMEEQLEEYDDTISESTYTETTSEESDMEIQEELDVELL